MKKYFIHNGQCEVGPFDFEQLKTMQLKNETPIWHGGLQNWTTANNIEELKSILNSNVSPPKFENFTQQNSNPPIFSNPVYENNQNFAPKKKKTLRNILIGVGVLSVLFFGLIIYASTNYEPNYDENGELIIIDSSAVSVDDEQDRINEELTIKNRSYRNNIEQYVEASTNQYSYNELGGISNLDIIVTNNTEYLLNEVNVAVDYIKDSGGIYKTEIVTIYNIPAKQDKSASAPESDRGTSVNAKVQSISSRKLHMCYDNSFAPKAGEIDPYFCRQ
ncbi:DUF4339 domain-containing protein [Flavobacterium sp. XS2P24]|uniref:DUF4339 domain-containing protein n=1 Tax=Flavobacterium sp. XS2P24 TaxID=3041249 RepID=UPI0024A9246B|nr:DUF4339 domain-containing protein [Flavobacterium sp. XS2P24]MDI6048648.1 DUF4339 domain-containing protein [Flavobacterium sp. XS2P24]